MKELSIEEKAQAYDKALERAKAIYQGSYKPDTAATIAKILQNIFPELKESEDERIRKAILELVRQSSEVLDKQNQNNMIAWLESIGEHADFLSKIQVGDKVTRNEGGVLVNISQLERVAKPRRVKPTDKVEPKFKVGDWVVTRYGKVNQVIAVDEDGDGFTLDDDTYFSGLWKDNYHLWTIQDAKDGDVLVVPPAKGSEHTEQIFIFKEIKDREYVKNAVEYYCRVLDNEFCVNVRGYMGQSDDYFVPATKEQCDTLFEKMHEAGYEWDAEKKELKKIEQKSAEWNEEDEKIISEAEVWLNTFCDYLDYLKDSSSESIPDVRVIINKLKSLKQRIGG